MLSGRSIIKAMEDGDIVIKPFNEEHLQPNSYDVVLGNWVVRFRLKRHTTRLGEDYDLQEVFDEPEWIRAGEEFILLPHERILCHTEEVIGTTRKFVAQLATRSTMARLGLDVCGSAGFGDVGFVNRWTLELQNQSPRAVSIPVGIRVAQFFFTRLETTGEADDVYQGSYQGGDKEWTPYDMIPKEIVG